MSEPSLILGTAGHIDHGKSSLIKALTGVDPDRLKEEKDRGITIELGFARLDLPSGRSMGVVDVPGHERFVRQMVAGSTGIDVVLLVVAADDGVMPQTREHLAIIDLLGVSRGVVALTKVDLVEEEWVDLVRADVERLLEGTGIAGAPIVAVSSRTGQGLDELRNAIDLMAETAPSKQARLPMRLPVDRVFTIPGAGTVVTGTLWSGSVTKEDPVEVLPSGRIGRVRSVQVHSEHVDRAHAGQRTAINISGIERDGIERGDVIAEPHTLSVTDRFDGRFTYLGLPGDDRAFESGTRVHVHHGTREVLGRVLLIEKDSLSPGESTLAQVRLEDAIAPRYGDRFIVRSYSPVFTIGGGIVLDALPPRRTILKPHERELLEALLIHDLAGASLGLLASRGMPMTSAEVAAALGVPRARVADELNQADLKRLKVGGETAFITADALDSLCESVGARLSRFHEDNPHAAGMPTAALRDVIDRRLTPKVFDALIAECAGRGTILTDGGIVRHATAAVSVATAEQEAEAALSPLIEAHGLSPVTVDELVARSGVDPGVGRRVLGRMVSSGKVIRIGADMHFSVEAIGTARSRLSDFLKAHPQGASAADLRDVLGVSRKFAIPLLEYFDAHGLTRREGDVRLLRAD